MADGFYTNDDDDEGCFGGYGNDGAWAYADVARGSEASLRPGFGSVPEPGDVEPTARRRKGFAGFFRSGSGGYGQAA